MLEYLVAILVVVAVVAGLWRLVIVWKSYEAELEAKGAADKRLMEAINRMPLEEVRQRAYALLDDPNAFTTVPRQGGGDESDIQGLPPLLRELFSRFDMIGDYGMQLCRAEIGPYEFDSSYVVIADSGEDCLLVRPPDETVYVLLEGETCDTLVDDPGYPTILHWILHQDEALSELYKNATSEPNQ
jgi:hypothetical protein